VLKAAADETRAVAIRSFMVNFAVSSTDEIEVDGDCTERVLSLLLARKLTSFGMRASVSAYPFVSTWKHEVLLSVLLHDRCVRHKLKRKIYVTQPVIGNGLVPGKDRMQKRGKFKQRREQIGHTENRKQ
jgi:hypothetical protein